MRCPGTGRGIREAGTSHSQHHGGVDVEAVADELYALPREEFTAARDARAKAARVAGDRDLATAIGRLPKPTSAAWVANLLAREHPGDVHNLHELGAALREAHATLAGATLQELSRQRHQVVHALVQRARALGRDAGKPVSEAVAREVADTVTAALSDPDAARALAAGRLATALSPGSPGSPGEGWFAGAGTAPRTAATGAPPERPDDGAQQQVIQELAEARVTAREAADAQRDAHRAVEDAEGRAREATGAAEDLVRRLAAAEQARDAADKEVRFARQAVEEADRHVADAERRIRDLEHRIGPGRGADVATGHRGRTDR